MMSISYHMRMAMYIFFIRRQWILRSMPSQPSTEWRLIHNVGYGHFIHLVMRSSFISSCFFFHECAESETTPLRILQVTRVGIGIHTHTGNSFLMAKVTQIEFTYISFCTWKAARAPTMRASEMFRYNGIWRERVLWILWVSAGAGWLLLLFFGSCETLTILGMTRIRSRSNFICYSFTGG